MTAKAIEDYQRIEKAILFLEQNALRQPDLEEIARSVNLSEYHFQRLFKRWAGISPKRFLQALTLERAKEALKRSRNLLAAAYDAGLSGSGRLHDLFVNIEQGGSVELSFIEIPATIHVTLAGNCAG